MHPKLTLAALAALALVAPAWATVIVKPVGANSPTPTYNGQLLAPSYDGTGLSTDLLSDDAVPALYPTHSSDYFAGGILEFTTRPAQITFDLGEIRTLSGFHVWNGNQAGGEYWVGIRDVDVSVSIVSAASGFGAPESFVLPAAAAPYRGSDAYFSAPITARWIRLDIRTGQAAPPDLCFCNSVQLSEIRFLANDSIVAVESESWGRVKGLFE